MVRIKTRPMKLLPVFLGPLVIKTAPRKTPSAPAHPSPPLSSSSASFLSLSESPPAALAGDGEVREPEQQPENNNPKKKKERTGTTAAVRRRSQRRSQRADVKAKVVRNRRMTSAAAAAAAAATTTTTTTASARKDPASLVGRSLKKRFGRATYAGRVTGLVRGARIDADRRAIVGPLFRVVYVDGDREELELHELLPLLQQR
jgi:hypothetical protein